MKHSRKLLELFLSGFFLVAPLSGKAQTTTNTWPGFTGLNVGPITNDCKINIVRKPQYNVTATSSENGIVVGDTNKWFWFEDQASITGIPSDHYKFSHWTGVPEGTSTNNPYTFTVTNACQGITANFVAKTNVFEDIQFYSMKMASWDRIALELAETSSLTNYHVYSSSNLMDNFWSELTNSPKTGTGSNLFFEVQLNDKIREFYRAKNSREE
jgi:hypothetical protein